jgi:hypothetical protein
VCFRKILPLPSVAKPAINFFTSGFDVSRWQYSLKFETGADEDVTAAG